MANSQEQEHLDELIKSLLASPDDAELLDKLSYFFLDEESMNDFGGKHIFNISEIKYKASKPNRSRLALLEAELRMIHQDPQTTWETLAEALIDDPENGKLLAAIEALNECVEDAPTFADEMESIARRVATDSFPREVFEYLKLALADPDYPDYFELADKIADGK